MVAFESFGPSNAGESPLTVREDSNYTLRYLYRRSSDCQASGEVGQDILRVGKLEDSLAFALCDGVSQSFFGEIAAEFLAESLVEWLLTEAANPRDGVSLRESLTAYLESLTEPGQVAVDQVEFDDVPALVAEVLEEKRIYGSESMFVCGLLCLTESPRVVLAGMGDSRLRFGLKGLPDEGLGLSFSSDQRWSTKRGLRNGSPQVYERMLTSGIWQLLAYSDGFAVLDDQPAGLEADALERLARECDKQPESDDLSLIEIWATVS